MKLMQYEPWHLVNDLNALFDSAIKRRTKSEEQNTDSRWAPAVDIREEAKQFVVAADLPGIDSKDIEIQTENNALTIKGTREIATESTGTSWHRVERVRGEFYRHFTLPDSADCEHIKAKFHNGVLEVMIPKASNTQPRKVKIESGKE